MSNLIGPTSTRVTDTRPGHPPCFDAASKSLPYYRCHPPLAFPGARTSRSNRKEIPMLLNSPEVQLLHAYLRTLTATLSGSRDRDERGEIAQTVIIVAILAAAAIAICTIIVTKFTDKANTIPTE